MCRRVFDADALLRPWFDRLLEDVPGARPVRRPHPRRAERSGRLQADARGAAGGARAGRREGARVPDARARRLPRGQRRGDRGRGRDVRRPPARAVPRRSRRTPARWRRRGAASTPASTGSSCTRAPSSSRSPSPSVRELVAAAHERRATVLIHAGRGIPALGQDTVRLAGEFPDARLILAHCAISDLSWLWRELPRPPERVHRHRVVEPGRRDRHVRAVPARPTSCGRATRPTAARSSPPRRRCGCALQAGLTPEQLRGVMGGQIGAHARRRGPARPRAGARARRRARSTRCSSASSPTSRRRWAARSCRADFSEPLALARLACAVGDDAPRAGLLRGARAPRPASTSTRPARGRPPDPGRRRACWCSR